ncbi:methylated-DNA--[protein]-cysteine S-methyltransferase [Pirellulales bacterium]|nr:methylated-DNA--[protein]-cysteine S-methyltransferase [Pirellulales bacterium]
MTFTVSATITACRDWTFATCSGPLGAMAVAVSHGRLAGVCFGHRTAGAAERDLRRRSQDRRLQDQRGGRSARRRGNVAVDDVLEQLQRYAEGEPLEFFPWDLFDNGETPFTLAVIAECRAIPRGETRTYGQLAAAAGHPGAARAVGRVMSSNPTPLIVPCHRVLAAGGKLGGYSARQGLAMKRRLLRLEAQ